MDSNFDVQFVMNKLTEVDKSYYTDMMILYAENRKRSRNTINSKDKTLKHLIKENE